MRSAFWPTARAAIRPGWPLRLAREQDSGLIVAGGGSPPSGVLAVVVAQHQDLCMDVGAVLRQVGFQYQPDLLPVKVPGSVFRRVEGELDHAMGCQRISVVV